MRKLSDFFYLKILIFLVVKFSMYLNRRDFVMCFIENHDLNASVASDLGLHYLPMSFYWTQGITGLTKKHTTGFGHSVTANYDDVEVTFPSKSQNHKA